MTTLAVTSVSSLLCHASTCFRIGSKFRCIRSTPTEMQSISENDFECFASTGVNTPETMSPNRRGLAPYGFQLSIRRISDQHTSCREERYKPTHNIAVLEVRLDRHRTGASTVFLVSGPICFAQQPSWIATRNIQNL